MNCRENFKNSIGDNINRIRQQIPETTRLVVVSKQASIEQIRLAYDVGVRDFAENRLQDALIKGDLEIGKTIIKNEGIPQGKQTFGKGLKVGGNAKIGDMTIENKSNRFN